MGRLFWKFLFTIWLVVALTGVGAGSAVWWLFHVRDGAPFATGRPSAPGMTAPRGPQHRPPVGFRSRGRPWALHHVAIGFAASLTASALLAWHLSRPIRTLHGAMDAVAQGRLGTRVGPAMGRRRDELGDLGRGFDHMVAQLQRVLEGQRRLLHDVSHELRSPLARLQAAVGLVRQNPARLEDTLDRVERESNRLDLLVGELLTLAELETEDGERPRERVDLVELVAAIAADAQFEAEAAGKQLTLRGAELDAVWAEVWAEPLYRAYENVVRNAVKFTAPGTAVEVVLGLEPRGFVVAVCDHGPGIPPEQQDGIFERFVRGPGGASGAGLGLAIARRAVEIHGGTIQLTNPPGGGLGVEITLPVAGEVVKVVKVATAP